MGEANNRGTFEERREQSLERQLNDGLARALATEPVDMLEAHLPEPKRASLFPQGAQVSPVVSVQRRSGFVFSAGER